MSLLTNAISSILEREKERDALRLCLSGGKHRTWTRRDLAENISSLAAFLNDLNLPEGAPCAVFSRRCPEQVGALLAAMQLGFPVAPLHPRFSLTQIRQLAPLFQGPLLVDWSGLARLGKMEPDDWQGRPIVIIDQDSPSPLHTAVWEKLSKRMAVLRWEKVDAAPSPPAACLSEESTAIILFTSGSTGQPKGVAIGHGDLARRVAAENNAYGNSEADCLLNLLPFSFDVGLNQLFCALSSGATLILQNSWLPEDMLRAAEAHSVTAVSGVPSLWMQLMDYDTSRAKTFFAGLRYCTVSGGSLSPARQRHLRQLAPETAIFKTYGQTETFRSAMLQPEDFDAFPESVGRPPDGVKVFVVDEAGDPLPPGETGELVHQGTGIMAEYLGDPESSTSKKKLWSPSSDLPPEPTVFTGDTARLDKAGYVYLLGRQDRMLKIRGNRIYPDEVERALGDAPDVAEAAVLGRLNPGTDEKEMWAFLRMEKTGTPPNLLTLRAYLGERLPAYMIPEHFEGVDAFPRTDSGKINYPELEGLLHEKG